MKIHPDITENKHGGDEASVAANPTVANKQRDCETILAFIAEKGKSYLKEIVAGTGIQVQTASGRIADLKRLQKIEVIKSEPRVEKCSVVRIFVLDEQLPLFTEKELGDNHATTN